MIGAIVALVTVLVTVAMLALIESRSEPKMECVTQEDKERIVRLSERGVEAGFQQHVAKLYTIWTQDDHEQPKRAKVGIQNGISSFIRAKADIELWLPRIC
jgi:hypothetical protein